MNDKENQELEEAIAALKMSDCDYYADLLERLRDYWELECECTIRDGSNPHCQAHKKSCPACGARPSKWN
jgi:hypothetical protein